MSASTKITVLQKGGFKHHEVLERACRAFLTARMSTRLANTLTIRIEVRSTKLKEDTLAVAKLPTNGSAVSKAFTVVLRRERPLSLQVCDLAHELIHVEQAATGRLQYRRWKSDGKVHARWEGADLGPVEGLAYATRPWEVEARSEETKMARTFFAADAKACREAGVGYWFAQKAAA